MSKSGVHFYTNGVISIKLKDGDIVPEGFSLGRTFKSNPWNKGLTKETSEKVKANTDAMRSTRASNGSYDSSWNKGLTKETNEILKETSKKISVSTKGRQSWNKGVSKSDESKRKQSESMRGKVPWNKGLTKEMHPSVLAISLKRKGTKCTVKDWATAKKKEYATRKKNGTWNTSRLEDDYFLKLVEEYGEGNVLRQYRDDRYPFNCDFYIPSEDLFIEFNGTWAHHTHPFNANCVDDIAQKELWLSKSDDGKMYYKYAVYTWTDLDVRKLNTFRQNNLNFQIIYPKSNLVISQ